MMGLVLFGNKGKGESVWLGFFLYNILDMFDKICVKVEKTEYVKKHEKIKDELKVKLNSNGWDGKWFRRAFMDDGNVLGSKVNDECKIDCIAQSWAVISGAGDSDKVKVAMESLEEYLIDKNVRNYKVTYASF